MNRIRFRLERERGFTLIETTIVFGVSIVFLAGVVTAFSGLQGAVVEGQTISELQLRSQRALDRIVTAASQALTTDSEFSALKPNTGVDSHCLRFRLLDSVDPLTGALVFNGDNVYIYGPDSGANPSAGLVMGRGTSLANVHGNGSGSDGVLGTRDDNTGAMTNGVPVVELLIPDTFAPQTGTMFEVDVNGRLLTFTLRVNAQDANGQFILPQDLVFTERVALRR